MGDEVVQFEEVSVEHGLLHLVEFVSADSVEIVTVQLFLEHPGVDVLVQVSRHAHVVVSEQLGVPFVLEEVRVGEFFLGSSHEFFII